MVATGAVLGSTACAESPRAVSASYDPFTAQLIQLQADQNRDGRADQWTFLRGNRVFRGEGDADGDGRIDRWEYFDQNGNLELVGSSSLNDGIEDTWTRSVADGEQRVDRSTLRDRALDRREYYRDGVLQRVEADTNADGLMDLWQRFENMRLREASVDTTRARGRPDRRLRYDQSGVLVGSEIDPDGDGQFVAAPRGGK